MNLSGTLKNNILTGLTHYFAVIVLAWIVSVTIYCGVTKNFAPTSSQLVALTTAALLVFTLVGITIFIKIRAFGVKREITVESFLITIAIRFFGVLVAWVAFASFTKINVSQLISWSILFYLISLAFDIYLDKQLLAHSKV